MWDYIVHKASDVPTLKCNFCWILHHILTMELRTDSVTKSKKQEAQLSPMDCASTLAVAQMVEELHLKSPAISEQPSRPFKVTAIIV